MSDQTKFWVQTLIIPIVLAIVGYVINHNLQSQQRELEKIKFTDQVVNEAFDSNNPDKALALTKIIPALIEDERFAETLCNLINQYYINKAEHAVRARNDTAYQKISDAANAFHSSGNSLLDLLKTNPTTSKAESARQFEQQGLDQLFQYKNWEEARKSFKKADEVYPGFHSSYEIANLLNDKINSIKNGGDTATVKQEVLQTIQSKYAWKLHPKTIIR